MKNPITALRRWKYKKEEILVALDPRKFNPVFREDLDRWVLSQDLTDGTRVIMRPIFSKDRWPGAEEAEGYKDLLIRFGGRPPQALNLTMELSFEVDPDRARPQEPVDLVDMRVPPD